MRAVNLLALWAFQGSGLTGVSALLGGDGVGRTLVVAMENVLPCSVNGEAVSMDTTSHFRMLPTSSCPGVYSRPLPTCTPQMNREQASQTKQAAACSEIGAALNIGHQQAHLNPGLPAVAEGVRVLDAPAMAIPILGLVAMLGGTCSFTHQVSCAVHVWHTLRNGLI